MPRFRLRWIVAGRRGALSSRLVAVGRRGSGHIARRHSLCGGPERAVAHPGGAAQRTPELGALALDGHQLPLCVGELLLEAQAVVAGDAGLAVAVRPVDPLAAAVERDAADVQLGGGEAHGEREQEKRGGEDAGDGRLLGEDRPAFEDDGAGGVVDEHQALDALVGVQDQQDGARDQGTTRQKTNTGYRPPRWGLPARRRSAGRPESDAAGISKPFARSARSRWRSMLP